MKNKSKDPDMTYTEYLTMMNITQNIKLNIGETFGELF